MAKKFSVGQYVRYTDKPEWGIGKIILDDGTSSINYLVKFERGEDNGRGGWFVDARDLVLVDPQPTDLSISVGDIVIVSVCEVTTRSDTNRRFRLKFASGDFAYAGSVLVPAGTSNDELENKPALAIGKVRSVSGEIVNVTFKDASGNYGSSSYYEAAVRRPEVIGKIEDKPTTKFVVGDKVIHVNKPEWGVGKVSKITIGEKASDYMSRADAESDNTKYVDTPYMVHYPHRTGRNSAGDWFTAEANLIKVVE